MTVERHPGSASAMPDDQLASVAVSMVVAELRWMPDVAPAVMDRISRDAVAYPEQFDRRLRRWRPDAAPPPPTGRSVRRTVGRLVVFAAILVIITGLITVAATVSAPAASAAVAMGLAC